MRIVLDTNVLIAAFVSHGQCHELLEHCAREHELLTSAFLLNEFQEKLTGKFRIPFGQVKDAVRLLRSQMEIVTPAALPAPVCRDPVDDQVIGTAVAANAVCLVTGDKDLLTLERYQNIRILPPSAFWSFEASAEPGG